MAELTQILDKYGLPVAFLAVVLFFVWKLGWPIVLKLIASLETQIAEARSARMSDQVNFLTALDKRDRVQETLTTVLNTLVGKVDDLCEEVRRK